MGHVEHRRAAPARVNFVIVTVSDTRGEEEDLSGKLLAQMIQDAGHVLVERARVKDDREEIQSLVVRLLAGGTADVILLTGGTGVARRDVTEESLRPLIEKEIPGFGEIFRHLSYRDIGPPAILSRALAGSSGGKIIIALPGSEAACRLAMEKLILPEAGHMVWEVRR